MTIKDDLVLPRKINASNPDTFARTAEEFSGDVYDFLRKLKARLLRIETVAASLQAPVTTPTPPVTQLVLDKISVPALCAFSATRKLRNAYASAAIRVRRSTDNSELDIGFTSGLLDTAALMTFVGAGSGFVTTIYDQGLSGRNLTQANTALQPIIVNAGALVVTANGRPTMTLDTGRTLERADACGMTGSPALTMAARFRCPSATGYPTLCRLGVSNFTTAGGIFSITLDQSAPRIYVETITNGCDFNTGGAATSKAWVARTAAGGPVSSYGLTENGSVCTVQSVSGNGAASTALANQRTAIGGGNGPAASVYRDATGDLNCFMLFNASLTGADLTTLDAELAAHL
jgi:hypothetical protein